MPNITSSDKQAIRRTRVVTSYSSVTGLSTQVTPSVENPAYTLRHKSKTWVRTPGFRALIAAKQALPDNSFDNFGYSLAGHGASFNKPLELQPNGWLRKTYSWTGPVGVFPVADTITEDLNALKSALVAKAKGNQWNVPIFVAEGRKTVEMVVNSATRLTLMARALRRGNFKEFARFAHPSAQTRLSDGSLRNRFGRHYAQNPENAFSSYWLEHTYGWVPFMSDTRSVVNTLMDTAERPDARIGSVRATIGRTETSTGPETSIYQDAAEGIYVYGKVTKSVQLQQKGTWKFAIKAADIPGRFGLLNPAEVIWELVPLSFVADWFLPIGDYLSALDVASRFDSFGGTYGKKISLQAHSIPTRVQPVGSSYTGFVGSCSSVRVKRTPIGLTVPSPSLLEMRFSADLGVTRAISAVALLHQFFGKR